jgi:hypothetical protein
MNALTDMDVTNAGVVWNDHRPQHLHFPHPCGSENAWSNFPLPQRQYPRARNAA